MKYCPVYKKCGGCAYINTEYADQLKNKKEYSVIVSKKQC